MHAERFARYQARAERVRLRCTFAGSGITARARPRNQACPTNQEQLRNPTMFDPLLQRFVSQFVHHFHMVSTIGLTGRRVYECSAASSLPIYTAMEPIPHLSLNPQRQLPSDHTGVPRATGCGSIAGFPGIQALFITCIWHADSMARRITVRDCVSGGVSNNRRRNDSEWTRQRGHSPKLGEGSSESGINDE